MNKYLVIHYDREDAHLSSHTKVEATNMFGALEAALNIQGKKWGWSDEGIKRELEFLISCLTTVSDEFACAGPLEVNDLLIYKI